MSIFIAGASRGVGRELAIALRHRSYPLLALLRSTDAQAELEGLGVAIAFGDALNPADLTRAMALQPTDQPIDTVISTIGGLPKDGERADYLGNRNLIDAAVTAGVTRFILVSSIGSGDSAIALPPHVLESLGPVLVEKAKAEQHLIASGLTYTIIRPGGLLSEPATGTAVLTPDPTIAGSIHRADVAQLVCRCLISPNTQNRVLSAVDRHKVYRPDPFETLDLADF